ncbi:MAG: oligosaccharide flippase family protein [Polynucleobacter sp.]
MLQFFYMSKSFFSASSALLLDRIFRAGIGLLVSIAIARHYGPTEFGQLSYVLLAASLFGVFATLGLDEIGPRDMAALHSDHPSRQDMLKTILRIRSFGGLLAYFLLVVFIYIEVGNEPTWWVALILGLYLPLQSADAYDYRFRVEKKFTLIAITRTVSALISSAFKVLSVVFGWPIYAISAAMTGEYAVNSIIFSRLNKYYFQSRGSFQFNYAKQLLNRSWKIILSGLVITFQSRIEYYLIEKFLGWNSVGQYAAALKIFEVLDMAPIIFSLLLLPELAVLISGAPRKKFIEAFQCAYLGGFFIYLAMLPIMVVIIIAFPFAFGHKYDLAQDLLPFLIIRPLFGMFTAVRGVFVILEHRYIYPLIASLMGLLVSFVLALLLIPRMGLYGAVAANLLGLFSSTILADLLFYRDSCRSWWTCFSQLSFVAGKIKSSLRMKNG